VQKLKYALIGCGRISKNHLSAAQNNDLDIAAICDILTDAMDDKIAKFDLGYLHKYTDHNEMLEKEALDLVAIATESGSHAEIALNCIRKGIHVIVEKPFTLSTSDAEEIISESKKYNVKVSVCHQNRFNKAIQVTRNAVESNALGKMLYSVANIRWNRDHDYFKQASWRGTWAQDGGALMNQCIHNIDLLLWMMGNKVTEVFAYTNRLTHPYIEAEDLGLAVVKFANGGYGIVEGTVNVYDSNFEETLCLFGSEGTIKIGGKSVNAIEHWKVKDSDESAESLHNRFSEDPPDVYGFGHTPLYKDMLDAIINNRKPYIDAVDGKNAIEFILAVHKSAVEGRPVNLPITNAATTDFANRFCN